MQVPRVLRRVGVQRVDPLLVQLQRLGAGHVCYAHVSPGGHTREGSAQEHSLDVPLGRRATEGSSCKRDDPLDM